MKKKSDWRVCVYFLVTPISKSFSISLTTQTPHFYQFIFLFFSLPYSPYSSTIVNPFEVDPENYDKAYSSLLTKLREKKRVEKGMREWAHSRGGKSQNEHKHKCECHYFFLFEGIVRFLWWVYYFCLVLNHSNHESRSIFWVWLSIFGDRDA